MHLLRDECEPRRAHRGPSEEVRQRRASIRSPIADARQITLQADGVGVPIQNDLDDLRRIGAQRVRTCRSIWKIRAAWLKDAVLHQSLLSLLQSRQRTLLLRVHPRGSSQ